MAGLVWGIDDWQYLPEQPSQQRWGRRGAWRPPGGEIFQWESGRTCQVPLHRLKIGLTWNTVLRLSCVSHCLTLSKCLAWHSKQRCLSYYNLMKNTKTARQWDRKFFIFYQAFLFVEASAWKSSTIDVARKCPVLEWRRSGWLVTNRLSGSGNWSA